MKFDKQLRKYVGMYANPVSRYLIIYQDFPTSLMTEIIQLSTHSGRYCNQEDSITLPYKFSSKKKIAI